MKRWFIIGGLMLVLALAAAPAAQAAGIRGTGELHAWGDGLAGVRGNGTVIVSGSGVLYFRDRAGDADWSVSGTGERRDLPSGWIIYYGFDGTFQVTGSHITVTLSGYNVDLQAKGTGLAILHGEGEYEVNGHHFFWRSDFEPIRLEP